MAQSSYPRMLKKLATIQNEAAHPSRLSKGGTHAASDLRIVDSYRPRMRNRSPYPVRIRACLQACRTPYPF